MIKKLLICAIVILLIQCGKKPASLSVEFIVTPETVPSGELLYRYLIATNDGGKKASVNRITIWEECISGWRQGEIDTIIDLPIQPPFPPVEINPGKTDTLFSGYIMETNYGETDLRWKSVGVVDWDGHTDSDSAFYMVLRAPSFKMTSRPSQ
jgi:hypothetical protein